MTKKLVKMKRKLLIIIMINIYSEFNKVTEENFSCKTSTSKFNNKDRFC